MNKLQSKFKSMRAAYRDLYLGSRTLLDLDNLYWTERWLLKLVSWLAEKRLGEIKEVMPVLETPDLQARLKEHMLEAQVEAALAGHELGEWEEVENGGYQAICKKCQMSVFVSGKTIYSILDDVCSGGKDNEGRSGGSGVRMKDLSLDI